MKQILMIIVVSVAASVYSTPVKSSLSAYGTNYSDWKSTPYVPASEYIQEGLIAMWDGIENAGWGVHDENATTWTDCISGLKFTPSGTIGDTVIFDSNCVTLSGGNSYLRRGSTEVKPIIQGNGSEAYFTVELCNRPISDIKTKNFAQYCSIGCQIGSYGYGVRWYVAENFTIRYLYVKNSLYFFTTHLTKEQPWTITIVSDGAESRWYLNGSLVNRATHGSTTGWYDNWYLGGGGSSGNYWQGDIFSHRFYNRALTDEEIAANRAIDTKRFVR